MNQFTKMLLAVLVTLPALIGRPLINDTDTSTVSLVDSGAIFFHLGELDIRDISKANWVAPENIDVETFTQIKEIWIKLKLPEKQFNDPAIFIEGFFPSTEIYVDTLIVFQKNNPEEADYIVVNKKIIPVKDLAAGDFLYLRLKFSKWYNPGGYSEVRVGNVDDLLEISTDKEIDEVFTVAFDVTVGGILIIISFLSVFFFIKRKEYRYHPFITFAVISFVAGIDHFIQTILILVVPFPIVFLIAFQLITLAIIPSALTILVYQIFGKGWRSFFKYFWIFHSVISSVYFALFFIKVEYLFLLPDIDFVVIIEIFLFIVVVVKSRFHKLKDSKYVFYSLLIFLIFALHDLIANTGIFPWAVSLYGFGVILISMSLFNLLMNNFTDKIKEAESYQSKIKEKELEVIKLNKENLQSQYEALKSQINPHFLFNTFSSLMTVIQDDKDKGVLFVQKLSNVYRYVLQSKDHELILLDEELNFINAYMYLLDKRFDSGLKYEIDISDKYYSYFVIPLSLQILIENCIKHNIVSERRPLTIEVFVDENNFLVVKNNLQTKTVLGDSTKIGLENIKNRYEHISDKKIIVSKTEKVFEVKIPLIKHMSGNESNNN